MTLPVSYVPSLNPNTIHCLLDGASGLLGSLSPSHIYNLTYTQAGRLHTTAYPVLFLPRPRLLAVASRLITQSEEIPVIGIGFDSRISYQCQYVEDGWKADGAFRAYFLAAASFGSATRLTCPSILDSPAYLPEPNAKGYVCLSIKLRDAITGHVFEAEPGSPAEFLTSPCFMTDITAYVPQSIDIQPRWLPLAYDDGALQLPDAERTLSLTLQRQLELLALFDSLGSPPTAIKLRFTNVVVNSATGSDVMELQQDLVNGTAVPSYLEIPCSILIGRLSCSPWPYLHDNNSVVSGTQASSALSLVFYYLENTYSAITA